jgi:hypothetical protein
MAGWSKELDPLSFLVVYNSGHLVPFNQPARSLELLDRFLSNTSFVDVEIPRLEFADPSMEDAWRDISTGVRTGVVVMALTITTAFRVRFVCHRNLELVAATSTVRFLPIRENRGDRRWRCCKPYPS